MKRGDRRSISTSRPEEHTAFLQKSSPIEDEECCLRCRGFVSTTRPPITLGHVTVNNMSICFYIFPGYFTALAYSFRLLASQGVTLRPKASPRSKRSTVSFDASSRRATLHFLGPTGFFRDRGSREYRCRRKDCWCQTNKCSSRTMRFCPLG